MASPAAPPTPLARLLTDPSLGRYVELETRLRPSETIHAPSGRTTVVHRLPVITSEGVRRIVDYLRGAGDFTSLPARRYGALEVSLDQWGGAAAGRMRPKLRVELSDDDDTLTEYVHAGCVFGDSPLLRAAWGKRMIKGTYIRDDASRGDGDQGPIRMAHSIEIPVGTGEESRRALSAAMGRWVSDARVLRNLAVLTPGEISNTVNTQWRRTFRYVQRQSFIRRSEGDRAITPVRVDISATRIVPGTGPTVGMPPPLSWEVEVEYVGTGYTRTAGGDMPARVVSNLVKVCRDLGFALLRQPPDSASFIDPEEARATLSALGALRDRTIRIRNTDRYVSVPKPRPVASLLDLCGTSLWTPKADGVSATLFVRWVEPGSDEPEERAHCKAYVLTDDGSTGLVVRGAPDDAARNLPEKLANSILVGEYTTATDGTTPLFLVFDALVVGGESLVRKEFEYRKGKAEELIGGLGRRQSFVWMKPFAKTHETALDYAPTVEVATGLRYRTDGVIIMGHGPLHVPGHTRPQVLKWKPRNEQTIDLLVHYDQTNGRFLFLCGGEVYLNAGRDERGASSRRTRRRRGGGRRGASRETRVYTYVPFVYEGVAWPRCSRDGGVAVDDAAGRCPPIESEAREAAGGVDLRIGDGMIVEFRVEPMPGGEGDRLVPVRMREDKTARYRRAMATVQRRQRRENDHESRTRGALAGALARHYKRSLESMRAIRHVPRLPHEWVGLSRPHGFDFPDVGGNKFENAVQTVDLARNPIAIEDIRGEREAGGVWATSYFGHREVRPLSVRHMVSRNNTGKGALIDRALDVATLRGNSRLRVLDLACGEGNDLPRWRVRHHRIETLVGIDRDECAVVEARRRLALRANGNVSDRTVYLQGDFETEGFVSPGGRANRGVAVASAEATFHVITIFFAVHYAKDAAAGDGLRALFRALAGKLVSGGVLVLTYMDAPSVLALLPSGSETYAHEGHFEVRNVVGEGASSSPHWDIYIRGLGHIPRESHVSRDELKEGAAGANLTCVLDEGLWESIPTTSLGANPGGPEAALGRTYRALIFHKAPHPPADRDGACPRDDEGDDEGPLVTLSPTDDDPDDDYPEQRNLYTPPYNPTSPSSPTYAPPPSDEDIPSIELA